MRLVISATGTEIGKTWITCALAHGLARRRISRIALKPIESGDGSDARALASATQSPTRSPPYLFDQPVSPHLAARLAGIEIDLGLCSRWVQEQSQGSDSSIIELAGGLLSPLNAKHTNADLLRLLAPDCWIAVAPDRLGVLHDLRALLIACRSLDLPLPLVVLNAPTVPDASTGTNARELSLLGLCEVAAVFHRSEPLSASTMHSADTLLDIALSVFVGTRQ